MEGTKFPRTSFSDSWAWVLGLSRLGCKHNVHNGNRHQLEVALRFHCCRYNCYIRHSCASVVEGFTEVGIPKQNATQQCVQWTGGYAARFSSFFAASGFPCFDGVSQPTHLPLTRAVSLQVIALSYRKQSINDFKPRTLQKRPKRTNRKR
jgi:hypothetical protein